MNINKLQSFLIRHPELLHAKWRKICSNEENKLAGHCALAAEVSYWLCGGKDNGWKQYHMTWEGFSHFFIKNVKTGDIIDPTCSQYKHTPNYNLGKGCWINQRGRGPTKRARIVLKAMGGQQWVN
jgi:hypothetical protein